MKGVPAELARDNGRHAPLHMDTDFAIELALLERLRAAAELLEELAGDRVLLNQLPAQDRARLLRAAAELYNPDKLARREMLKAAERERTERTGAVLAIRNRRRPAAKIAAVFRRRRSAVANRVA